MIVEEAIEAELARLEKIEAAAKALLADRRQRQGELKSLLPGNGILRAETKGPKRLRKFTDAIAETKSR
jgi:hypothetical protein